MDEQTIQKARKRTHRVWANMIANCHDPRVRDYVRYGGLPSPYTISVCDRWRESFDAFVSDMGLAFTPRTVGLINFDPDAKMKDGKVFYFGYQPGNCYWCGYYTKTRAYNAFIRDVKKFRPRILEEAAEKAEADRQEGIKAFVRGEAQKRKTSRIGVGGRPAGTFTDQSLRLLYLLASSGSALTAGQVGELVGEKVEKVAPYLSRLAENGLLAVTGKRPRRYTATEAGRLRFEPVTSF